MKTRPKYTGARGPGKGTGQGANHRFIVFFSVSGGLSLGFRDPIRYKARVPAVTQ